MKCLSYIFNSWCELGDFELQPTIEIPCSYFMGTRYLLQEDFEPNIESSTRKFVFNLVDRGSIYAIYEFKGFI